MGLQIKQNKEGKFSLMSTVTDELIHDKKWVSEDEAKKLLIENIVWDAYKEIIKIDRCFPYHNFSINDQGGLPDKKLRSYHKELDEVNVPNGWNLIIEKIREINSRLGLTIMDIVKSNQAQANSSYQKDVNRLKSVCTKLTCKNTLRKKQISSWSNFFTKLLREKRITKDELKQYTVPQNYNINK